MNKRGYVALGGSFLFAFSSMTEALAERLKIVEVPHIHADIFLPEAYPSTLAPISVSGALTVDATHSVDAFIAVPARKSQR